MRGVVKKDEEGNFIVAYSRECVEDSEAVIRVSCKLMPMFEHFKDGDAIEFELIEFAQEDGSFSSYAKPYLTINPHISKIVNKNYEVITDDEEDTTLGRKFEKLYQGFINGDFVATDLLKENCVEIADEFAIEFTEWKDDNFSMYGDKTYYAKTSFQYFDITKYAGKEKPTKYYITKELLEIYKKEKGL